MEITKFPITRLGLERMKNELEELKKERPNIIKAISDARDHGDLSENAEYHAAREKQSFIEGRIAYLGDKLSHAEVIDIDNFLGDTIAFGATVELCIDGNPDKKCIYTIVGEYEADVSKQLISVTSPLASTLIGKKVGDSVEVETPNGEKSYTVVNIEFK
ncbi:MAG: transcription elongation factor GreA [Candidatus Mesenet longicola]|uniref:Transcription elongation factor GreA n=1 Tax=Candidatus Mesenet longicola TaxID=1892558 RepID=A0A8J3MNP7_9RICK|nr:MAG: transcription elongation factor GreA [Candidatus Mesenet longicola]GHM59178.1 MAG: transcription elongation factor GreA [Candidatus Mesenet longicola]